MTQGKRVHLILVRHTQTDFNVAGRYTGQRCDPPLNDVGKQQAQDLAVRLAKFPIVAVHSSNMRRTGMVARYIVDALGGELPVRYDPRLWELCVGDASGLTKKEVLAKHPGKPFKPSTTDYDFREIGGESYQQVVARQVECFDEALEEYGSDDFKEISMNRVVLVGHGTSLRSMLHHLKIQPPTLHEQGGFNDVLYGG